ncbi:MAG: HAMP domain-containing histidine kinase, partial [Chitinophagaceae bacterium]
GYGNEELLFTAFRNIVVNACKYSSDHHAVVSLTLTGKAFVIEVSDRGIGMADAEMKKIFQPFYRIQESRSVPGFGLGLSLANRIIRLHKGTVNVTSEKGIGTTFTVALPVARPVTD